MIERSHAEPETMRVQRLRRVALWVLAVDFVALGVLGIWLSFGYEPGATLAGVHGVLGILAVAAALVAAVATVADQERSTSRMLPTIVVLLVVAGMYLTGPTLAWDQVIPRGPIDEPKGVVVGFDDDVAAINRGNESMTPGEYQRVAWLHLIALPAFVIVMGGAGLWAARRRGHAYVPRRALSDEPA